ncbi:MAG: hypothetical protein ACJAS7_000183 [Alpinimonas sp.]|jgi:hypothetical protein
MNPRGRPAGGDTTIVHVRCDDSRAYLNIIGKVRQDIGNIDGEEISVKRAG